MPTPTAKITPQAESSLRAVANVLASKYTGQILLDCNQGGVRSITLKHKVPIDDPDPEESP